MFRLAKEGEENKLNQIIIQAATRIQDKGSKQWASMLDGSALTEVKEKIKKNEAFVFELENEIVGMLYAAKAPNDWDKNIWGNKSMDSAIYIHRVAVADGFQGKKIPHMMIKELQRMTLHSKIRLDCLAHKEVLNNLYTGLNFKLVGVKENYYSDFEQNAHINLYECDMNVQECKEAL